MLIKISFHFCRVITVVVFLWVAVVRVFPVTACHAYYELNKISPGVSKYYGVDKKTVHFLLLKFKRTEVHFHFFLFWGGWRLNICWRWKSGFSCACGCMSCLSSFVFHFLHSHLWKCARVWERFAIQIQVWYLHVFKILHLLEVINMQSASGQDQSKLPVFQVTYRKLTFGPSRCCLSWRSPWSSYKMWRMARCMKAWPMARTPRVPSSSTCSWFSVTLPSVTSGIPGS